MKRILLAGLLHLGYWLISILGVYTLTGMGHGSYVAFALLWSFSALQLGLGLANSVTFFLLPFLQITAYWLAWILADSSAADRKRFAFALPALHLLGAAFCWLFYLPHVGPGFWSSTFICLGLLSLFWWCYFRLLFPSKGRWEQITISSEQ